MKKTILILALFLAGCGEEKKSSNEQPDTGQIRSAEYFIENYAKSHDFIHDCKMSNSEDINQECLNALYGDWIVETRRITDNQNSVEYFLSNKQIREWVFFHCEFYKDFIVQDNIYCVNVRSAQQKVDNK